MVLVKRASENGCTQRVYGQMHVLDADLICILHMFCFFLFIVRVNQRIYCGTRLLLVVMVVFKAAVSTLQPLRLI
jgi:hypothetical protein